MYGSDFSTVDPNPSVYSYGDSDSADAFSQAASVVGQWGTAIASIVTGNPVASVSTPQGVQTIGARGSTSMSPSVFASNSGVLLLIGAAVVVILLLKK